MKTGASILFKVSPTEFVELSEIEHFADDSGYVSMIRVGSGVFSCAGKQFYFEQLPSFLAELKKRYNEVSGYAELRTRYEKEFIRFEFTSRGHVVVTGLLLDYGNFNQNFQFGFEVDQTFIPPFITSVESAVVDLK